MAENENINGFSLDEHSRINERGNKVTYNGPYFMRERYYYDCKLDEDWCQFDTWQDASYFGVWVNAKLMQTLTFAEGDVSLVECPDFEHFMAEIENMHEFYETGKHGLPLTTTGGFA